MPSEISQRKNTIWYRLYVESKKAKLIETETRAAATGGWEGRETGRYWTQGTTYQLQDD